jgi:hypothetical protein
MSSFDSFRIVCWHLIYFHRDRAENLHPEWFNCGRCVRFEKDIKNGCPRCELTQKLDIYKDEMRRDIKRKVGRYPKGYGLEKLMELVGTVSTILARNRNHVSRAWDRRTARLAEILILERNQAQAIDTFDRNQKSQETARQRTRIRDNGDR